ncbi:MAG: hypothetical protein H0Z35_13005 [Thermoanaerobacteraceae bacterium]|nr:hypothetical protein [Thermoanaerobacteraceae bacterium]
MRRKVCLLTLAVFFVMLFAGTALAYENWQEKGLTSCSGCHNDGRTPADYQTAAKAPKAATGIKQTVTLSYAGKTVKIQAVNKNRRLYVPAKDFNSLLGANVTGDLVPLRKTTEDMGLKVHYENGTVYIYGATAPKVGLNPALALPGYVGSETCAKCHSDKVNSWMTTDHATMVQSMDDPNAHIVANFKTNKWFDKDDVLYAIAQGKRFLKLNDGKLQYAEAQWDEEAKKWVETAPRDYTCGQCHNTGFNPETGAWAENGISCEACHGPGEAHAQTADASKIVSNPGVEMCESCHGGDRQVGPMREADNHLTFFSKKVDGEGYYADSCIECHSATVRLAEEKGEPVPTLEDFRNGSYQNDRYGITCVVCHDPHANTGEEFQLRDFEVPAFVPEEEKANWFAAWDMPAKVCVDCHTNEEAPVAGKEVHHPQKEWFEGKAIGVERILPPSAHMNCTTCHMTDGNHKFKVGTPTLTLVSHGNEYEANSCNSCHSDMTEEKINTIQEATKAKHAELQGQLDALGTKLDEAKAAGEDTTEAQALYDAAFTNLSEVEAEGSWGLHSKAFTDAVLAKVEADLAKLAELLAD